MPGLSRVLVCFALRAEAAAFRRAARALGGIDIRFTGIGPDNAATAIRAALANNPPELVVSSGFAGGLDPRLPRGTMVFDTDDPELQRQLAALGARHAKFLTTRRIATTATEKRALRETTRADAVEMESGAIREVCKERNVPFVILRVISDAAEEDLPLDFNSLADSKMRLSYTRLAVRLLRSPGKIADLMRFQKQTSDCGRRQAETLSTFITSLRARAKG